MFQKCLFAAATLFAAVEAALYYPPIISPAAGDVIAAGSNFTLKWSGFLLHFRRVLLLPSQEKRRKEKNPYFNLNVRR